MTKGYLRDLKENDPEKLKEVVKLGVAKRRKKAEFRKTFADIYAGILDATVVLKDKAGNILRDEKGRPREVTQKEALAMASINTLKNSPDGVKIKNIIELASILGEIKNSQENEVEADYIKNELFKITTETSYDKDK
jgi:transcription termination factor NusB